jgi:hypothetical protein
MPRKLRPLGERAQVSAPIELFVAVIILAMSMALAFTVIRQSSENRCLAEMKNNLRGLEAAIVDVAVGSPPTTRTFNLEMKVCETRAVDAVRVVYFGDARYCQACPGQFGGCWKLEPVSRDREGNLRPITEASVCVNIAGRILLVDESLGFRPGEQGGISPDQACTELSDTPCPKTLCTPAGTGCEEYQACLAGQSGIPRFVWDPENPESQNTTFQTIGKVGNVQAYRVRLRKGTAVTGGGESIGAINICVVPAFVPRAA